MPSLIPDYQYQFIVTIRDNWDQIWMDQHEGTGFVPLGTIIHMMRSSYEAYAHARTEHDREERRAAQREAFADTMNTDIWEAWRSPNIMPSYQLQANAAQGLSGQQGLGLAYSNQMTAPPPMIRPSWAANYIRPNELLPAARVLSEEEQVAGDMHVRRMLEQWRDRHRPKTKHRATVTPLPLP